MGIGLSSGAPAPRLVVLAGLIGALALAVAVAALRSPPELALHFWAAWITGAVAALLSSWVWVLKPRDASVRLYALSGIATLGFSFAAAGMHIPAAAPWMMALLMFNVCAASAFGLIMIALFAGYPTKLRHARWIVVTACAVFGGWLAWAMAEPQRLIIEVHRITLAEMTLIVALGAAQVIVARGDSVRSAIAMWLGVCVLMGAGGFIATVAAPSAFGAPALMPAEYAFLFFLIIYGGLAVGLLRYRVFGLGRWAFQLLFSAGAASAVLLVDAALILILSWEPSTAIGIALFVAALVYLPLRAWLWGRLTHRKRLDEAALVRAMIDISLQPQPEQRVAQWRALLTALFSPLELAQQQSAETQAHVAEEGRVLVTPAGRGIPSFALRERDGGRVLFSPEDEATVAQLMALAAYLDDSRLAYDRGVAAERARIARDIHDNIGAQLLSALHVRENPRKDELIRDAIGEIRAVIRNAAGQQEQFADVIADLRAETVERLEAQGLEFSWQTEGQSPGAPLPLAMLAMRALVREGVSNVLRHAQAKHVAITISVDGDALRLRIADDGVGIGSSDGPGRGLINMQQRASNLGGTCTIAARARGTEIEAYFPAFAVARA
jgi:Signal transduction histidine kinase